VCAIQTRVKNQYTTVVHHEAAASIGESKPIYPCVKEVSCHMPQTVLIKDSLGFTLKTHVEEAARWKEHFSSVFNCPEPEFIHNFQDDEFMPE